MEPTEDERLIRGSVQLTRAQWDWIREVGRRRGVLPAAAVLRMLVHELMAADYRATAPDDDTAQG